MPFKLRQCRACGGAVTDILDLGASPIANALLSEPDADPPRYPLGLVDCAECGLVQNRTALPDDLLFAPDYPYFASVSAAVRAHADDIATALASHLPKGATTLEVGSNDGAVQAALAQRGITAIGVDPATGPALAARAKGLTVINAGFDARVVDQVLTDHGPVTAVHMCNVLAHVNTPKQLIENAKSVLAPGGFIMIEVQSWRALVTAGAFDMVYHEHHAHFSLGSLAALLRDAGLGITAVEDIAMQGGSLRVWCQPDTAHSADIAPAIKAEAAALADAPARLDAALKRFRGDVARFLHDLGDRPLYGYGAAAKTVTLIAASGCDWPLQAVADAAPSKIGRYLPMGGVPIIAPAALEARGPATLFLFAWNLAREIAPRFAGSRIMVPVPHLHELT